MRFYSRGLKSRRARKTGIRNTEGRIGGVLDHGGQSQGRAEETVSGQVEGGKGHLHTGSFQNAC